MPAKSWRGALLQGKCPRCREGNIFKHRASHVLKFSEMHTHCQVCGISFEPEPGFYYGAMFISYAFTVAIMVGISLVVYITVAPASDWVYILSSVIGTILCVPWMFRYSRISFLFWFGGIKYDPNWHRI